ncbi:hypothetical protein Tco_1369504 [Tanacetum coccineum]
MCSGYSKCQSSLWHVLDSSFSIRHGILSSSRQRHLQVVDRVMHPLALKQTCKPRSDRGKPKARHSVSSSSAYHYVSSSHHVDEDEDDDDSCASTPSPTTYLNSLLPLNYEKYDIPTSSQQNHDLLFERQTDLLNQTQQIHEEVRGGFKLFGKALRGVFEKKKK